MHIVTQRHLAEVAKRDKDVAREIGIWLAIIEGARWRNFMELQAIFKDADAVDGYVIFNIRGNRYRLITVVHYAKDKPTATNGHIYIRSFLRHAEYDDRRKWDPYAGE